MFSKLAVAAALIVGGLVPAISRADSPEPTTADGFYRRAKALAKKGDYAAADRDFTRAIELNPRSVPFLEARADLRFYELHQDKRAVQDLTKLIAMDPNEARYYHRRAVARSRALDDAGALADFNKAIELSPNDARLYRDRGAFWSNRKGDFKKAVADFDRAIALDPNDPRYRLDRATDRIVLKDFQGALRDCDKAVELDPKFSPAYTNRSLARMYVGDWNGALADAEKSLRLLPNEASALAVRGLARMKLGKQAEGQEDLRLALKMEPSLKGTVDFLTERFLGKPAPSTAGRATAPK